MSDQKDQFKFDLDAKDAAAQLDGILGKVKSIGDSKNLAGLIEGFSAMAGPLAAIAAGMLAFKVAFDLTIQGEQLAKINNQFEELSKQAGLSSNTLREGIQKSIGASHDLDDTLQLVNKSLIQLGPNAERVPQLLELARKTSKVFGGEMESNFESISNAIASGNTRLLRQQGLIIDSDKAYKKYAESIGATVNTLSEQGKQQAILNAVLSKGEEKFKNISADSKTLGETIKEIQVAFKGLTDAISMMMEKSGFMKDLFNSWKWALNEVTEVVKGKFGSELDQANAKVGKLSDELIQMREILRQRESGEEGWWSKLTGDSTDDLNKKIEETRKALQEAMSARQALEDSKKQKQQEQDDSIQKNDPVLVDNSKKLEQENKFQKDLLRLSQARLESEMQIQTNADEFRLQQQMQVNALISQYDLQIAETKRQGAAGELITKQQADQMIIQLEADKAAKIEAIMRDLDQKSLQVYDNKVKGAKTASEGIKAAFAQGAAQAQDSMKNYGQQGQLVFKTLTSNAASAFRALGDGSKSAGDAMKGFLLGSIADIAEAQGQFLLSSGIGAYDPIQIAEGGALIALAGLLRSQAGAAGGGGIGGSSGGGGGGGGSSSPSANAISEKPELEAEKKKAVTVQIMGNYFETEQTKTRLLEMIRENTDATDFKYQQIGVGG